MPKITRRSFLKHSAGIGAVLSLAPSISMPATLPITLQTSISHDILQQSFSPLTDTWAMKQWIGFATYNDSSLAYTWSGIACRYAADGFPPLMYYADNIRPDNLQEARHAAYECFQSGPKPIGPALKALEQLIRPDDIYDYLISTDFSIHALFYSDYYSQEDINAGRHLTEMLNLSLRHLQPSETVRFEGLLAAVRKEERRGWSVREWLRFSNPANVARQANDLIPTCIDGRIECEGHSSYGVKFRSEQACSSDGHTERDYAEADIAYHRGERYNRAPWPD